MRALFLLCATMGILHGADLFSVRSVYLLPMSRGMDQFLANRLTTEHVFQVVTDAKVADAILTDRIGEAFEQKLAEVLPSEQAEKEAPERSGDQAQRAPARAEESKQSPEQSAEQGPAGAIAGETKLPNSTLSSSFGRARGMVFLVDPKSHEVLWSAYQPPKDTSSGQMEHSASEIVNRLKHDLKRR